MGEDGSVAPRDDFSPHGYLDNPWHSWKLNPSGVLRSRPPAGMGWHVPNLGSYGRNQFSSRAHLHVGVEAKGTRLLTPEEFRRAKVAVGCDLHTKNRLRYRWRHPVGVEVAATFFLAGEQALGCRVELTAAKGPIGLRLWLAMEVVHNPATSRLWEHGFYTVLPGAEEPETGACGLLGIAPEGDAWCHGAVVEGKSLAPALARGEQAPWLLDKYGTAREPEGMQVATLLLAYDLTVEPGRPLVARALLGRGVSADAALGAWRAGQDSFEVALAEHGAEDERFWSRAPQLSGDWPGHWRRGMATDVETLRMVARPAMGVFTRRWDGMQIQAPRAVLAETALDALALSWADPAAAQELLLSCFAAARRANVPCQREDGSYNMVADDGAICGTGPEWGWPFLVAEALWQRGADEAWRTAMAPHLAAYADWWLTHRVDAEGWLVHACSWESGQDVSTRFGSQSTGGSDVRHLRPIDLQVAAAHACRLAGMWSPEGELRTRLLRAGSKLQTRYSEVFWRKGEYADYDARRGAWSAVRDPMQLAPFIFPRTDRDLTPERQAALLRALDDLPPHCGVYPAMVWPPVALTVLEAAIAGGAPGAATEEGAGRAAALAWGILERVWSRMDGRELEPDGAIPGVTREYWPEGGGDVSAGIEGYGWGALTVHFLLRYVIGLRQAGPSTLLLAPALPVALRRPGATYSVGPIALGRGSVTVTYTVPADAASGQVGVSLALEGAWSRARAFDAKQVYDDVEGSEGGVLRLAWTSGWLQPVYCTLDEG